MTEPRPNSATSATKVENMGFVSAKIDEQKTEETKQKVIALVNAL